ncbi:MAG: WbqC family protein [Candidatus Omnitrophica bacterium]|nr:WbqC family protein [Candidatus Omnitrophota bacterium]
MILSAHQPQYLPWLGFFDKVARSDGFVFLDTVQYKAREFQNRNKIRTSGGWIWLTVPVYGRGKYRQAVRDVRIDNEFPWAKQHRESFRSAYGRAAFYKDHQAFLEQLYAGTWDRLIDLSVYIIRYVLEYVAIKTPLYFESDLGTTLTRTERIIELCRKLNADTYLSGAGGREYLEEEKFREAGIELTYQQFGHPVYQQLFVTAEKPFLPNMCIFDLLLNEGPRSRDVLSV